MNKTYNSENTEHLKNVVKELLKEEVSNLDVITNELLMYAIGDSYNMKTVLNKTRALAIPKEFEKANIKLEVPYRSNQKDWKPVFDRKHLGIQAQTPCSPCRKDTCNKNYICKNCLL